MVRKALVFVIIFALSPISVSGSTGFKKVDITRNGKLLAAVKVEIADTSAERARGLMFRKELPQGQGMWFVFKQDSIHPFWMRNTYISLDIIFIDAGNKIVSIARSTTPLSSERVYPDGTYRYVLEVNAGFADRHGLKRGDRVELK